MYFAEVLIWPWMFFKVYRDCPFSVSEISVLANPSCVVGCQTSGKTIKGSTHRSSCSNSQWSNLLCVGLGRIDSLGNASEGGVVACGRQLNDLQYEVEDSWDWKQVQRTKFAQFKVIIKQLEQFGSKKKTTNTEIEVTVVRGRHIGYRGSWRTSANN